MKQCVKPIEPFKACAVCRTEWQSRDDFVSDANIVLIGYQVDFEDLLEGFFLFNHNCENTLTIPVAAFGDMYDGPIFDTPLVGTDHCPGHCLHEDNLKQCPAKCECVFVREIIQVLKQAPKIDTL